MMIDIILLLLHIMMIEQETGIEKGLREIEIEIETVSGREREILLGPKEEDNTADHLHQLDLPLTLIVAACLAAGLDLLPLLPLLGERGGLLELVLLQVLGIETEIGKIESEIGTAREPNIGKEEKV